MYGSVVNVDLSEILQCMLHKYISGNALQLYTNEIKGIDALDWKAFPQALIVSDGSILCDTIEDRITQPKELLLNNTSEQAQP
jgi:para-nitrobenzyl esterase